MIASWSLERTCWRGFTAQQGGCKISRIAPFNAITIIIIIYPESLLSSDVDSNCLICYDFVVAVVTLMTISDVLQLQQTQ